MKLHKIQHAKGADAPLDFRLRGNDEAKFLILRTCEKSTPQIVIFHTGESSPQIVIFRTGESLPQIVILREGGEHSDIVILYRKKRK